MKSSFRFRSYNDVNWAAVPWTVGLFCSYMYIYKVQLNLKYNLNIESDVRYRVILLYMTYTSPINLMLYSQCGEYHVLYYIYEYVSFKAN